MRGQWLGSYEGTPNGSIAVNIDELGSCYEGTAYLHPNKTTTGAIPMSEVVFRTTDKRTDTFTFTTTALFALHPQTLERVPWETIKHLYAPDAYLSSLVSVSGRLAVDVLHLAWANENGQTGRCALKASATALNKPSALQGEVVTWEEFKKIVFVLAKQDRFIFRGQSEPWRLRTAFHRRGRSDLRRFQEQDIPQLHKVLASCATWASRRGPYFRA